MIPQPSKSLSDLAIKLATAIAPETTSRFALSNTGMISMLLLALAQDSERAVANRMADIEDMRALFQSDAAAAAPGADLRATYCSRSPDGLLLSQMDTFHAQGFELLIELHAWAEGRDPALDAAIWELLRTHTERNKFELPSL